MTKDSTYWDAPRLQLEISERIATSRAGMSPERNAQQAQVLAKWRSK